MWDVNPSIDKNKIKVVDLMNIVGLELESSEVGMVKLNKKKEELASKVNNTMGCLRFHAINYYRNWDKATNIVHIWPISRP